MVLLSVQRFHHVSKLTNGVQIINHYTQGELCEKRGQVHKPHITVKPSTFACPIFPELNKTGKLKGAHTGTITTLTGICVGIYDLNSPK